MKLKIFLLACVVAWALPPAPTLMPQPPARVTLPETVRSADGSMPLVSKVVLLTTDWNSYFAIVSAS